MNGLGSFKGSALPALPSVNPSSRGLGSFSAPALNSASPGLPTLNTNTGTTSFQQMYTDKYGGTPNSDLSSYQYTVYPGGGAPGDFLRAIRDYEAGRGIYSDPSVPPPIPPNNIKRVKSIDNIPKISKYISDYRSKKGIYAIGDASWENGYASGGLVSLGSGYRSGGAVEPQAEPHGAAMTPQASPSDASSDPTTDKLYMGAMMALDPSYPMSDEDRNMIIETFIMEFGEDALVELEAEVAARSSDGTSDSIPATLNGKPAALSEGEYVVPADAVSGLGQGSTEAGARRLDELVRSTRSAVASNVDRPIGPSPIR